MRGKGGGSFREQLRALAVLSLLQAAAGGSVLDASEQALEMQAARWIDEFDKDDNDRLSTTELNVLMKAMMSTGQAPSEDAPQHGSYKAMKEMDTDGDGQATKSELLAFLQTAQKKAQEAKTVTAPICEISAVLHLCLGRRATTRFVQITKTRPKVKRHGAAFGSSSHTSASENVVPLCRSTEMRSVSRPLVRSSRPSSESIHLALATRADPSSSPPHSMCMLWK